MGRGIARGAVISIGVLLAGCSTTLLVSVAGPLHEPVFTPERRAGPICLSELTVRVDQPAPSSDAQEVWKIEGRDGQCVRFTQLVYGKAPAEFVERIPARPLREGVVYSAVARGDIRGPLGAVWIGGGVYVFEDGAWRPAGS